MQLKQYSHSNKYEYTGDIFMNRDDTLKRLNNYLDATQSQMRIKSFNSINSLTERIKQKADGTYNGPKTHMLFYYLWPFLFLVPLGLYIAYLILMRVCDSDLVLKVTALVTNTSQLTILTYIYIIICVLFSKILQRKNNIKVQKSKNDFELRKQEAKREAEMVSFQHKMLANQMSLIIDETEDIYSYNIKYNIKKIIELIESKKANSIEEALIISYKDELKKYR